MIPGVPWGLKTMSASLTSQLGMLPKIGYYTRTLPYGYHNFGSKRVYVIKCNRDRYQRTFLLILTWALTLFLIIKLSYLVLFEGLVILESLNIFIPIIIYCVASVIHINLAWKLEEHEELINQFLFYLEKFKSKW